MDMEGISNIIDEGSLVRNQITTGVGMDHMTDETANNVPSPVVDMAFSLPLLTETGSVFEETRYGGNAAHYPGPTFPLVVTDTSEQAAIPASLPAATFPPTGTEPVADQTPGHSGVVANSEGDVWKCLLIGCGTVNHKSAAQCARCMFPRPSPEQVRDAKQAAATAKMLRSADLCQDTTALEEVASLYNDVSQRHAKLEDDYQTLREENAQQEEHQQVMRDRIAHLEGEHVVVMGNLASLEEDHQALREQKDFLQQHLDKMVNKHDVLEGEHHALQETHKLLVKTKEQLILEHVEAIDELTALRGVHGLLQDEYAAFKTVALTNQADQQQKMVELQEELSDAVKQRDAIALRERRAQEFHSKKLRFGLLTIVLVFFTFVATRFPMVFDKMPVIFNGATEGHHLPSFVGKFSPLAVQQEQELSAPHQNSSSADILCDWQQTASSKKQERDRAEPTAAQELLSQVDIFDIVKSGDVQLLHKLDALGVIGSIPDINKLFPFRPMWTIWSAWDMTPLMIASCQGFTDVVKLLLKVLDIDANFQDEQNGFTALILASKEGHSGTVEALLSHTNLLVNSITKRGRTALLEASCNNDFAIVQALLAHPKADVNAQDEESASFSCFTAINLFWIQDGVTALTCSRQNQCSRRVLQTLVHDFDAHFQNEHGRIEYALDNCKRYKLLIEEMLLAKGATDTPPPQQESFERSNKPAHKKDDKEILMLGM